MRKAIEIALQIAHGLSAAHERGIVHRDLKPENIFLTQDGHTKLLDFGLAKATAGSCVAQRGTYFELTHVANHADRARRSDGHGSATWRRSRCAARPVDHRADIFSFGAVLYEMLCGKRAFTGDTSVEIMTAILKSEPPEIDLEQLKVPPALDRIVRHCLEKESGRSLSVGARSDFCAGSFIGIGVHFRTSCTAGEQRRIPAVGSRWRARLLLALAGDRDCIFYFDRRPR